MDHGSGELNSVSAMTIARCWRKSRVLTANYAAEVNAVEVKMWLMVEKKNEINGMIEAMKKLTIMTVDDDPVTEQLFGETGLEDEVRWLKIEGDNEIKNPLVQDALEVVSNFKVEERNGEKSSSIADEDGGIISPQPSEVEIRSSFEIIKTMAIASAVVDAFYHLRRAKAALLNAKRKENAKQQQQMLITELL